MAGAVAIQGFRDVSKLERDLKKMGEESPFELRKTLREIAEPVRALAEGLAAKNITNIGPVWSGMRVGVTTSAVYVAPKMRRKGGTARPNMGNLLLAQMESALDQSEDKVEAGLELMLDRLADRNGF